ncbi:hypothetical protein Aca07nite_51980 [Actinoplanes capillaceus]|uniref:Uncharacterized protein n=1 Tax=Actinoplanes campanulatus TaxID=113559 RepID=A0ABQ3WNT2_9ACTN|nr:hypothetical protein [Actinoplanes capillaceus]GID47923.1 hypothetical protein Aca07nite_51980 [Actinoplanes capillaceus]
MTTAPTAPGSAPATTPDLLAAAPSIWSMGAYPLRHPPPGLSPTGGPNNG